MESFNANLQGGKKLVKSLEKQSVSLEPGSHALVPCVAMVLRTPRLPPLPSPPPGASASCCIIAREGMAAAVKAAVHARSHCHPPVAAQPVACLQAPATPAIVAGMEEGAAFNVGSNASSQQRVIMPVHA